MGAGAVRMGRAEVVIGAKVDSALSKIQEVNNGIVNMGRNTLGLARTLVRTGALMAAPFALATLDAGRYERSLSLITGLVGVAESEVRGFDAAIKDMAVEMAKTPEELADAMFFITSAGLRGQDALDALRVSAMASAAGLGETKVIADLVTSAMNAYGPAVLNARNATDVLVAAVREGKAEAPALAQSMGMVLPLASAMGVSFNQVGAAIAAMTRTGTDAGTASIQLRQILATMLNPTAAAKAVFERFGFTADGIRDKIRNQGLIATLQEMYQAMGDDQEAIGTAFGNIRALSGVLDLLGGNVAENIALFRRMQNTTGSLDQAFQVASRTYMFTLQQIWVAVKLVILRIGEAVMPMFKAIGELIVPILKGIGKWISENQWLAQTIVGVAAGLALLGVAMVFDGLRLIVIGKLLQWITSIAQVFMIVLRGVYSAILLVRHVTILWTIAKKVLAASSIIGAIVIGTVSTAMKVFAIAGLLATGAAMLFDLVMGTTSLTVGLVKIALGLATGAMALFGIGTAATTAAVETAKTGFSLLSATVGILTTVLLASPIVVIGIAIWRAVRATRALTDAWREMTEVISGGAGRIATDATTLWGRISSNAMSTFRAVRTAIQNQDWDNLWSLAVAAFKLAWHDIKTFLQDTFIELKYMGLGVINAMGRTIKRLLTEIGGQILILVGDALNRDDLRNRGRRIIGESNTNAITEEAVATVSLELRRRIERNMATMGAGDPRRAEAQRQLDLLAAGRVGNVNGTQVLNRHTLEQWAAAAQAAGMTVEEMLNMRDRVLRGPPPERAPAQPPQFQPIDAQAGHQHDFLMGETPEQFAARRQREMAAVGLNRDQQREALAAELAARQRVARGLTGIGEDAAAIGGALFGGIGQNLLGIGRGLDVLSGGAFEQAIRAAGATVGGPPQQSAVEALGGFSAASILGRLGGSTPEERAAAAAEENGGRLEAIRDHLAAIREEGGVVLT